jgi:hypothetical protein
MAESKFEKMVDRFLGVPSYESEFTRFMRDYLGTHPEEIESQKAGRAAWWDKTPENRSPVPPMRHTPMAGGNEATFEADSDE